MNRELKKTSDPCDPPDPQDCLNSFTLGAEGAGGSHKKVEITTIIENSRFLLNKSQVLPDKWLVLSDKCHFLLNNSFLIRGILN